MKTSLARRSQVDVCSCNLNDCALRYIATLFASGRGSQVTQTVLSFGTQLARRRLASAETTHLSEFEYAVSAQANRERGHMERLQLEWPGASGLGKSMVIGTFRGDLFRACSALARMVLLAIVPRDRFPLMTATPCSCLFPLAPWCCLS